MAELGLEQGSLLLLYHAASSRAKHRNITGHFLQEGGLSALMNHSRCRARSTVCNTCRARYKVADSEWKSVHLERKARRLFFKGMSGMGRNDEEGQPENGGLSPD